MPTTTARAATVAGITTMMAAYIAANPTLLRRHYRFRPPAYGETPFSYLDLRPESIHYDASTRERTITADIVVLDQWTEAGEVMDRLDVLADSLVSFMSQSTYYHIASGASSWWSDLQITDEAQDGHVGFRIRFDVHLMDGSQ